MSQITTAPQFNPPSPSLPGKPSIPVYTPPPPTTLPNLPWATLHTITLSDLDSPSPATREALIQQTKTAITEDGFLFLEDYGVSLEQLWRQFGIAEFLHGGIGEIEMGNVEGEGDGEKNLLWDPEGGSFAGWKRGYGWKREKGKPDGIEQFNFYAKEFEDLERVPKCVRPLMDEITAFVDYLTNSVNRRLLKLLSLVLELPEDYLWDNVQSHDGVVGDGYFRHALFHPLQGQAKKEAEGVRMRGHTDHGTTTFLFSVPITALQIWKDEQWMFVPYKPGALVINLGETLEVISGGHLKATLHKVAEPPEDQQNEKRLSLVLFNASRGSMKLRPVVESPLIQREGFVQKEGVFMQFKKLIDAGLSVPTCKEWREIQISKVHRREENLDERKEVDGRKLREDKFLGVSVVMPV